MILFKKLPCVTKKMLRQQLQLCRNTSNIILGMDVLHGEGCQHKKVPDIATGNNCRIFASIIHYVLDRGRL